jgi:ribosomal protein S18 acetylase RimI-like enzyme
VGTIRRDANRVGIVIRELVSGDRDAVSRILQTCGGFTSEEIRVALELVDDALVRGIDGDYLIFVAERQREVCGYVCVGRTPLTASTWHLYWLCVDASVQGAGVGRALESHAEAFARERRGERLVLETSSQPWYESARRFYEGCGFKQVGRIPDFYKSNDDCIIYCKELIA